MEVAALSGNEDNAEDEICLMSPSAHSEEEKKESRGQKPPPLLPIRNIMNEDDDVDREGDEDDD